MSIKVMTDVWLHCRARSGDLLVQLALADFTNEEGDAFPAIATLARKARLSPRQVKRSLDRLQRLGELAVFKKMGPHGVNRYRILLGDKLSLVGKAGGDILSPPSKAGGDILSPPSKADGDILGKQGDILGKEVVTWASPNPLRNPSKIRKEGEERSGGPVDTVDNMSKIGNPLFYLSKGLRESFAKHMKKNQS